MIDNVARAIHVQTAKVREGFDQSPIPPYEHDKAGFYTDMAKAAIEAMREPSDEMLRAWVAAELEDDADPDEMVPVPGTGQGDMQFYERWRDVVELLSVRKRHKALMDAALEGE